MSDSNHKIFIVEDEVVVAFEMSDMLEDLGFEVVGPSVHLEDAKKKAEDKEIDVAVLDVNLGRGKTSEPVARILRERDIPFVFLSAYGRQDIGFAQDHEPVLKKPISGRMLVEALKTRIAKD